jgi:hypothetical protein
VNRYLNASQNLIDVYLRTLNVLAANQNKLGDHTSYVFPIAGTQHRPCVPADVSSDGKADQEEVDAIKTRSIPPKERSPCRKYKRIRHKKVSKCRECACFYSLLMVKNLQVHAPPPVVHTTPQCWCSPLRDDLPIPPLANMLL